MIIKPLYKYRSISSIKALSKALVFPEEVLLDVANTSSKYYRPNPPEYREDGTVKRQTYSVNEPLKSIQSNINSEILKKVLYPKYIQGGIKDHISPRDYISDACIHRKSKSLVSVDISKFFPSVHEQLVLDTWQYFFNFPREVSLLLTKLTTFNNMLPQGAPTSSYIANLLFWEREYILHGDLGKRGFRYSRYIDDITVSSLRGICAAEFNWAISNVFQMLHSYGLKVNRRKLKPQTSRNAVQVHGLNVNSGIASLSKKDKSAIRSAVYQCEQIAQKKPRTTEQIDILKRAYRHAIGKVGKLKRVNKAKADKLLFRLYMIKEQYPGIV